ncbi:MAG: small ribosomal subunit Rsm22 family protein, partial [Bacillota bacterium]
CRGPRSRLHRALKGGDAPYEDEKFCYMAFTKEPCEKTVARVLRHPIIEPGRVTLTLCTPEGIQKSVVTKRSNDAFKHARKTDWGGGWSIR